MKKPLILTLITIISSCNIPSAKRPGTLKAQANTATAIAQTCLDAMYQSDYSAYKRVKKEDLINKTDSTAGWFDYHVVVVKNKLFLKDVHLEWNRVPVNYEAISDSTDFYTRFKSFIELDSLTYDSTKASAKFFWISHTYFFKFRLIKLNNKWSITKVEKIAADD